MKEITDDGPIDAVTFDFDGLMFNTEQVYEIVNDVMLERRNCVSDPAVVARMMGRPGPVALQIMVEAYDLDDDVSYLELESQEIYLELIGRGVDPMPGLFDLLAALESLGIPKSIATSSRRLMVQPLLEQSQLLSRFEFMLTAEDVTAHKPDPQVYQRSATLLGVACSRVLVLEDSTVGCRAGVAAGAVTVAIPSKHASQHDYAGARFIADSLADARILALLGLAAS